MEKNLMILAVAAIIILGAVIFATQQPSKAGPTPYDIGPNTCGNDICAGSEDCSTCPDDCGDCEIFSPEDVWKNREALIDQRLMIEGSVIKTDMGCTEMACPPEDPCCNGCSGQLGFKISTHEKLNFDGTYDGKRIGCDGDSCIQECHPFEPGTYLVDAILRKHETYGVYTLELQSFETV
jgi:hypothetical protein